MPLFPGCSFPLPSCQRAIRLHQRPAMLIANQPASQPTSQPTRVFKSQAALKRENHLFPGPSQEKKKHRLGLIHGVVPHRRGDALQVLRFCNKRKRRFRSRWGWPKPERKQNDNQQDTGQWNKQRTRGTDRKTKCQKENQKKDQEKQLITPKYLKRRVPIRALTSIA